MAEILSKARFDDTGDSYAYRGFNYKVRTGSRNFTVRTYDDEPGIVTVIAPTNARSLPEAKELTNFLIVSLGVKELRFYHGSDGYRSVNTETLEFI